MEGYVEEIVLALAKIIQENRELRKKVDHLCLDKAISDSHIEVLKTNSAKAQLKYNTLTDIKTNNAMADSMTAAGLSHNCPKVDWRKVLKELDELRI